MRAQIRLKGNLQTVKEYRAGHIMCGKNNKNKDNDTISFTALCLQTSNLKNKPRKINGKISTSKKILSCTCVLVKLA